MYTNHHPGMVRSILIIISFTTTLLLTHPFPTQIFQGTPYRDNEEKKYVRLSTGGKTVLTFPCVPGECMEICLARFWSQTRTIAINVSVHFKGVLISTHDGTPMLSMQGGCKVSSGIRMSSHLHTTEVSPQGKLEKVRRTIKPSPPGTVVPLGERDRHNDDVTSLYALNLTYKFDLSEATDIKVSPTINPKTYTLTLTLTLTGDINPSSLCLFALGCTMMLPAILTTFLINPNPNPNLPHFRVSTAITMFSIAMLACYTRHFV